MINKIKNFFAKKIIAIVENSNKKAKENLWENFINNPNVNIDKSFYSKNTAIFKGENAIYGRINIDEDFSLREYCNILVYPNATLNIGKRVFLNNYCSINCLEKIEIGDDTLFGEGVKMYDHNHLIDSNKSIFVHKDQFSKAPIRIGKNCWLGSNVVILKGVTIGDNAVIGAGCVIFKDVPSNCIVKSNQQLLIEKI